MSLAAAMMISVGSVSAQAAEDGLNVLSDIKLKGQIRPRVEYTDFEGAGSAGETYTQRINLNIDAALFEVDGLRAVLELNTVNDFGTLDHTGHQTAAEADVAKMSQGHISYKTGDVTGIVGRKTLNLDNQRFVGSVGWKQNFQTLDLGAVAYAKDDFSFIGAYVFGVNAIGDAGNETKGDIYGGGTTSGETESVVLNASYKVSDPLKLTAYAYMLGSHSDTYGLSLTGVVPVSDGVKLNYRAEYAMQTDASLETKNAGKPKRDSDYMNLDVNANLDGLLLGVNYEVLGAADTAGYIAFQTPLATKHKFNGWADVFLGTPADGLVDMNLMVGYKSKELGLLKAVYHDFSSDEGSIDYGTELDLLYKRAIPGLKNVTGMLKYANYSADDSAASGNPKATDRQIVWAMLDYKFSI